MAPCNLTGIILLFSAMASGILTGVTYPFSYGTRYPEWSHYVLIHDTRYPKWALVISLTYSEEYRHGHYVPKSQISHFDFSK
jgi:hypothetical protein